MKKSKKIKRQMMRKYNIVENISSNVKNINKRRKKDIKKIIRNEKNLKKYKEMPGIISVKKRIQYMLYFVLLVWIFLMFRVLWIQLGKGEQLKLEAYEGQVLNRKVTPKRGKIFDSTGKNQLAVSSSVETVSITPANISKDNKERVAKILSETFELEYDKIFKKVSRRSSIETIVKKVDKEKTNQLREILERENLLDGIHIDEDSKRFYPYSTLAANVIGFCGSDNQGLDGIEAVYDTRLKGEYGKIERQVNAVGKDIEDSKENYVAPIDGDDLYLTIDATIQGIAEKYLSEACIDNVCTDGGNIVIMNPKNGDILALASYPTYNLNEPYTINNEDMKNNWDNISSTDRTIALQKMWRNKAISDTYEPGSTFKLVTASSAIEEGLTSPDNEGEFCCTGGIEIAGVRIKCWRYYRPHGSQSLRQALMNSCNPIFIGLGQRIGIDKYYSYLNKFGLLRKTGVDLPGEGNSIFLAKEKVGPVELATISFGQRFEITPIQMITAVSTIANKGKYVRPRVVKQIYNKKTNEMETIEPIYGDQVISEKTSADVLSMMGSVVAQGTGKNAQVKGYSIGGKTGTSEDGVNTGKYVTSFVGVSTVEDPQVAILITLYNPTGEGGHQGGGVAAPIASQVLGEVLPYLEIQKNNTDEDELEKEVEVPNLMNMKYEEASNLLKDMGMSIEIKKEEKNDKKQQDKLVSYQYPVAGAVIKKKVKIVVELK